MASGVQELLSSWTEQIVCVCVCVCVCVDKSGGAFPSCAPIPSLHMTSSALSTLACNYCIS